MAGIQEPLGLLNNQFPTVFSGLFLAASGALLSKPLLTMPEENSDSTSIFLAVYAILFLFIPITFFLNMLLLLLHVATHVGAPVVPLPVSFLRYLRRAAQTVSAATLLLGSPLCVHVALTEDSMGSTIGPGLVCLALVAVFIYSFVKLLIISCHTSTGFVLALFALCNSTGLVLFVDPLLSFSNHFLSFFLIPFTFMLGITLFILRISTALADEQQAATRAEHLVTVGALSAAFATLLVGMYTTAHMAATDMAAVGG